MNFKNKNNLLLCTTALFSCLASSQALATNIQVPMPTVLNSDYGTLTFTPQTPGGNSGGMATIVGSMTVTNVTSTFASPTPFSSSSTPSFIIGSTTAPVTLTLGSVSGSNTINPITFSGTGNTLTLSNSGGGYNALGLVQVSGGNSLNVTPDSQYDLSRAVFSGAGTLNLTTSSAAVLGILGAVEVGTLNITGSANASSGQLVFTGQVKNWTSANINATNGNISFNNGCITDAGIMNITGGSNTILFSSQPGEIALLATSVNINSGNVTIANGLFGGNLTLLNDATLNLNNSAGIFNATPSGTAGNIILNQDNIGTITIQNVVPTITLIDGTIGSANRLKLLDFEGAPGDTLRFNGDIHTYKLQHSGGTIGFGSNVNIDAPQWNIGPTSGVKTAAIDLSGNRRVNHTGTMNINTNTTFVVDWTANNTITYSSPGVVSSTTSVPQNFSILTLDTVSVSPGTSVTFKLSDGSALPAYTNAPFFNLTNVINPDGLLPNGIISGNTFFNFAAVPVSPIYGAQSGVIFVQPAGINFGDLMSQSGATDEGVEYAKGIASNLTGITYNPSLVEHSKEVLALGYMSPNDQVNYVNKEGNTTATQLRSNQQNTVQLVANAVALRQQTSLNITTSGVASGDECTESSKTVGVWADGFGGIANQKTRKKVPGFKSNTYGAVIGLDRELNDNMIVGLATAVAKSTLKYKSIKQGDKTKATTYTISAYGSYDFGNNFIARGHAMVGKTYTKAQEGHTSARTGNITNSNSKHNSMLYSTELLGGYKKQVAECTHLIPMAGFKYASFGKISYTEIIPNRGSRDISAKSRNYFAGLIGANLLMNHTVLNDKTLATNFRAFVEYDFLNKAPRSNITLGGMNTPVSTGLTKPARTSYSLGLDTALYSSNIEYGVNYTANIADKYLGHQGSIKIKVKL